MSDKDSQRNFIKTDSVISNIEDHYTVFTKKFEHNVRLIANKEVHTACASYKPATSVS